MSRRVRARVEACLAGAFGAAAIVTLVWRDWIEALTGFDPDRHDGAVELLIVVALAALCVGFGLASRADRRPPGPAAAAER